MADLLRISEAASLALHAMALLAGGQRRRLTTGEMASKLHVSQAHLSKVLQRLAKAGLVTSARGPKGGFALGNPPERIALLQVYQAIEGPLDPGDCILGLRRCAASRCILGNVVGTVNKRVKDYLTRTRLSDLRDVFRSGRG